VTNQLSVNPASVGVWAPAWYDAVERSTGFEAPTWAEPRPLSADLQRIADEARPHYEALARYRLRTRTSTNAARPLSPSRASASVCKLNDETVV